MTQSQNSSAKIALSVDDYFLNYHDSMSRERSYDWSKIEDFVMYTTQEVFIFHRSAYYFRMLFKIVDDFIPTGIMNHLIEKYYTKKWTFRKVGKDPRVLTVNDLAFGFNIWLGSCLLSFLAFLAELVVRFMKRPRKIKHAKVYPDRYTLRDNTCYDLKPDLVENFRIKNKSSNHSVINLV